MHQLIYSVAQFLPHFYFLYRSKRLCSIKKLTMVLGFNYVYSLFLSLPTICIQYTACVLLVTYSDTSSMDNSLHFSIGSENSFKRCLMRSSNVSCSSSFDKLSLASTVVRFSLSKALFLVLRFSSDKQLISRWYF